MGGRACATELLNNAISERRQVSHRSQVDGKLCDDVQ